MIYRFSIVTPANTLYSSKKRTVLKLTKGTIHQIDMRFPPGPQGVLHLQLARGRHQVWPTNPNGDFAGDGEIISGKEHREIRSAPSQLEAYTWNTSTQYEHEVVIRIWVLKRMFL